MWIKPPGESDGDYPTSTHTHGDPHCDPNGTNTDGNGNTYPTGSIPGFDVAAGQWFPAEFQMLVTQRLPVLLMLRHCHDSHPAPFAGLAALILSAAGLGGLSVMTAAPASAATGCSVAYAVQSDWGTGFVVNLTITNLGSPITTWTLTYSYAGNQALASGWNGNWSQSGNNVTVTNASYNGSLATGGTAQPGAQFAYSGTNTNPTAFALNGVPCTGQVSGGGGSIVASPTSLSVTQGTTGTVGISLSAAPSANVTVTTTRASGTPGCR